MSFIQHSIKTVLKSILLTFLYTAIAYSILRTETTNNVLLISTTIILIATTIAIWFIQKPKSRIGTIFSATAVTAFAMFFTTTTLLFLPTIEAVLPLKHIKQSKQRIALALNNINRPNPRPEIVVYAKNAKDQNVVIAKFQSKRRFRPITAHFLTTPEGKLFSIAIKAAEHSNHGKKGDLSISIKGIARGIYQAIRKKLGLYKGKISGGSTITQQLASNLQANGRRHLKMNLKGLFRKYNELVQAAILHTHLTPKTILKSYINVMPTGNGSRGYYKACEYLFGAKGCNTSLKTIYAAGTFKSPVNYRITKTALRYRGYKRTRWIYNRMRALFHIPQDTEIEECLRNNAKKDCLQPKNEKQHQAAVKYSATRNYIRHILKKHKIWQNKELKKAKGGVLRIYTTLNYLHFKTKKVVIKIGKDAKAKMGTTSAPTVTGIVLERNLVRAAAINNNSNTLVTRTESHGSTWKIPLIYTIIKYNPKRINIPFNNTPTQGRCAALVWKRQKPYTFCADHLSKTIISAEEFIARSENIASIKALSSVTEWATPRQTYIASREAITQAILWHAKHPTNQRNQETSQFRWLKKVCSATTDKPTTKNATWCAALMLKHHLKRFAKVIAKIPNLNREQQLKEYMRYRFVQELRKNKASIELYNSVIAYTPQFAETITAHNEQKAEQLETLQQKRRRSGWQEKKITYLKENLPIWKQHEKHFPLITAQIPVVQKRVAQNTFTDYTLINLNYNKEWRTWVGVWLVGTLIQRAAPKAFETIPPTPSMLLGSIDLNLMELAVLFRCMITGHCQPPRLIEEAVLYYPNGTTKDIDQLTTATRPTPLPTKEQRSTFLRIASAPIQHSKGTARHINKKITKECMVGKTGTSQRWIQATLIGAFANNTACKSPYIIAIHLDKRPLCIEEGETREEQRKCSGIPSHKRRKVQGNFSDSGIVSILKRIKQQ